MDHKQKLAKFCYFLLLFAFVGQSTCRNYKHRSKLQFSPSAKGYINILVAISPQIPDSDCVQVVEELQSTLRETSSLLFSATDGRAHFSTIKILLPRLTCLQFNSTADAQPGVAYVDADLKIVDNHPLAGNLPWTRSYRSCSYGGEDIFIPTNFLLNDAFSRRERAGLLLKEWAKFRYGVFDEFGYHGDTLYGACYKGGGGAGRYLTSCASTQLPPLEGNGECRNEVENKKEDYLNRLNSSVDASSIMFMSHLDSITKFCTNANHNSVSPTKQNVFCGGQSVTQVLNSHPDFASSSQMTQPRLQRQVPSTRFSFIRPKIGDYKPGFVFIIEDTALIREQNRLRYLKQSLVSIISLLPTAPTGTGVQLGIIDSRLDITIGEYVDLDDDAKKAAFISKIPDLGSLTADEKLRNSTTNYIPPRLNRQGPRIQLTDLIDKALVATGSYANFDWELVLLTNTGSEGFSAAATSLSGSSAPLTVVTLDGGDPRWTEMYGVSNTRGVHSFQADCSVQHQICSGWSGLIVEGVMESLRSHGQGPQWHKVGEGTLSAGQISTVVVDNVPERGRAYRFFISVLEPRPTVRVHPPNGAGAECTVQLVHGYGYLLGVSGCIMENGNWTVDLTALSGTAAPCQVTVWAEASTSPLNIISSLGADRRVELGPNGGVPVYARVSDGYDAPVISANVGVELFSSSGRVAGSDVILRDDGLDPDLTQDDGIYSGFLTSFSPSPEFHTGRIRVVTSNAKVVNTIGPLDAALLDPRLSGKCCGSRVPIATTTPTSDGSLISILAGFRTRESFDPESIPPGRIGIIMIMNDDGSQLRLSFDAPDANLGGGGGYLSHYQTCCTTAGEMSSSSSCHSITPSSDCFPVEAGMTQSCILTRSSMASNYLNDSNQVTLNCGVRGVNSNGVAGQVSMTTFVLQLSSTDLGGRTTEECKSLSDDCLPISLFWGMIGCIGGLLLILLALIIFWCVWAHRKPRQKTKPTGNREEVLLSTTNRTRNRPEISHSDKVEDPKNVQNQPPTTTAPLTVNLPSTAAVNQPSKESPLYNVYVNKAFITDGDGGMKLVAADGQLLPLDDGSPTPLMTSSKNLPRHAQDPSNPPTTLTKVPHASRFGGVSVVQVPPVRRRSIPDHDIKDDMPIYKANNNTNARPQPPPKPARPNSQQRNSVPVPRHRLPRPESGYANANNQAATPAATPQRPLTAMDFPVYASVNRNGRSRTPTNPTVPNVTSGFSTFRPTTQPQRQGIPPHFGGRSKDDSFIPSTTRFSPKRYDAFPSSDSDTYSDMSRSVSVVASQPRNGGGPLLQNRMGGGKPPPYNPPPPPPPPQPASHKKMEMQEDEYDDDSEHWDDEDFDFQAPGVSYA